jgi:hypothetical protein
MNLTLEDGKKHLDPNGEDRKKDFKAKKVVKGLNACFF